MNDSWMLIFEERAKEIEKKHKEYFDERRKTQPNFTIKRCYSLSSVGNRGFDFNRDLPKEIIDDLFSLYHSVTGR